MHLAKAISMLNVNPKPDEDYRRELSSMDLLFGSPFWGPVLRVGLGVLVGLLLCIAFLWSVTEKE